MIKIGDTLPKTPLKIVTEDGAKDTNLCDYTAGKKTILFAVPGAFTPTCSAKHVPGYLAHIDDFTQHGIDQIACFAVNDPFVMKAWAEAQQTQGKIAMLCDGNGTVTQDLGLTLDLSAHNLGHRSHRFAMVIDNSKVTQLYVEKPGEFTVSGAEHVLGVLG